MSQTNRIHINAMLRQALTTGHAVMGGSTGSLSGTGALAGTSAMFSDSGTLTALEQRAALAEAARTTLDQAGWTVTLVDATDPDGYAGLEATRGTEHLLAAIAADDLITDQSGAHDCAATADVLMAGLRAAGAEVAITDSVPHDGLGGSLYAVAGGPPPPPAPPPPPPRPPPQVPRPAPHHRGQLRCPRSSPDRSTQRQTLRHRSPTGGANYCAGSG